MPVAPPGVRRRPLGAPARVVRTAPAGPIPLRFADSVANALIGTAAAICGWALEQPASQPTQATRTQNCYATAPSGTASATLAPSRQKRLDAHVMPTVSVPAVSVIGPTYNRAGVAHRFLLDSARRHRRAGHIAPAGARVRQALREKWSCAEAHLLLAFLHCPTAAQHAAQAVWRLADTASASLLPGRPLR